MRERRHTYRGRVYYGGRIAINERRSTLDCIVRNFSNAGAKIEFAEATMLPDDVDLRTVGKGLAYRAHLIWRRTGEAGLAFRDRVPMAAVISLEQQLRQRASERLRRSLQQRIDHLTSEL